MLKSVENASSFAFVSHTVLKILHHVFYQMKMAAILDLEVIVTSKLQNNHSSVFTMLKSVENDTSFVFVSHTVPEMLHFVFFQIKMAAILNLEVIVTSKLQNNHSSVFTILK